MKKLRKRKYDGTLPMDTRRNFKWLNKLSLEMLHKGFEFGLYQSPALECEETHKELASTNSK